MEFSTLSFDELSNHQLYKLLQLRSKVFVVEQNCVYQDIDGIDTEATTLHVLGGDVKVYGRIYLAAGTPHLGRIVCDSDSRGNGYAGQLLRSMIETCSKQWPEASIAISAQVRLEKWYGSFGFETTSESYLEDGIEHIDMVRKPADVASKGEKSGSS